ncbi:MAG: hypothetical protein AB7H92_09535 [Microbacteriaceae bacterium]
MTTRPHHGALDRPRPSRRPAPCDRPSGGSGGDVTLLAASQARHPSAAQRSLPVEHSGCVGCGYQAADPVSAARSVSDLVVLARRALDPGEAAGGVDGPGRPSPAGCARFERVARLRDELHATANRVERFRLTDDPVIDAVRVRAARAASAMLSPGQVLHQLDLVADRLVQVLGALTPGEWRRVGRIGDSVITPGGLIDDVIHAARHDLLDMAAVEGAPPG